MNSSYEFVKADSALVLSELISAYEEKTGRTLLPADPDRLFLSWVADVIIAERVRQNYVGNQNIPSRASGENLDALGKWIYGAERKGAQKASCTVRFYLSEAQETAISVPKGTKVTDKNANIVFETSEHIYIAAGKRYGDAEAVCMTAGDVGNGYAKGQINTLVDIDNVLFYASCENIDTSAGGAEEETDDEYFVRIRESLSGLSAAGSSGAYEYYAKSVTKHIADVKAVRPRGEISISAEVINTLDGGKAAFFPKYEALQIFSEGGTKAAENTDYTVSDYGTELVKIAITSGGVLDGASVLKATYYADGAGEVDIYAIGDDGKPANENIKKQILDACSADDVRPLTDLVKVKDPKKREYDIELEYFVSSENKENPKDIEEKVKNAVRDFSDWQSSRLGRDINPSRLCSLIMACGVKRVNIKKPVFAYLSDGSDGTVPEYASCESVTLTNGGYEYE